MISASSTLLDVAFSASTALSDNGIIAVLCGGSAASYYCDAYQSLDADFVLRYHARPSEVDDAIAKIGFSRDRSGIYVHPKSKFTIEFPAGPVAVGRKLITEWRTVLRDNETLDVLACEDVVCDRFLHFWAWGDRSARAVALRVARSTDVLDVNRIEAWGCQEMAFDPLYDRTTWETFVAEVRRRPSHT